MKSIALILSQILLLCVVPANESQHISAKQIAETISVLKSIKPVEDPNEVPSSARPLLTKLKHELRDIILETLNSGEVIGSKQVLDRVMKQLEQERIRIYANVKQAAASDSDEEECLRGEIENIVAYEVHDFPDLMVATTTVDYCCASDSSLYLFKKQNTQWKLVLSYEVNDYVKISEAHGLFSYIIQVDKANKTPYVITGEVSPWCTSNWQGIRYKVLTPGSDSYNPKILLNMKDTIYLGVKPPAYQLTANADGFILTYHGGEKFDPEVVIPPIQKISYSIRNGKVEKSSVSP